jgi:hypothetical protein
MSMEVIRTPAGVTNKCGDAIGVDQRGHFPSVESMLPTVLHAGHLPASVLSVR